MGARRHQFALLAATTGAGQDASTFFRLIANQQRRQGLGEQALTHTPLTVDQQGVRQPILIKSLLQAGPGLVQPGH